MKASPDIVAAAAHWSAMLDADDVPQHQRAACEAWCAQNPTHRQVLERMRAFGDSIDALAPPERRTLARLSTDKRPRRTRKRTALLSVSALAIGGWILAQSFTARQWGPDYQTARGEQRTITLDDSSTLLMDTDSKLSVSVDSGQRMITLFRGRLFTTVAHDPQRPFVVATREGTATALGTAFSVRQDESSTEVEVAESRVEICTRNRADCVVLHPGDRARIEDATLTRLASTGAASTPTWSTGWLEVDDRPLPEVLSELNRYSAQPIRFEANELAEFRVTGSYPLRDPQRAVTAIARHLGLEIRQLPEGGVAVSRP